MFNNDQMKYFFFVLLFTLSFCSSAQTDKQDQVFEIRCDSAALARQQLQSMILIREFVMEQGLNPTTKLMMSEFNTFGQPTYLETSTNFSVDYDDYFASFKIQQRLEYNAQHRLSNYSSNYKANTQCNQIEYDEVGNMTRYVSGCDSAYATELLMQWKAGKMVKATFVDAYKSTYPIERSMNSAGKMAAYRTNDRYVTYEYATIGKDERCTIKMYLKDTLHSVNIRQFTLNKHLSTYSLSLNYKGDTLGLVTVGYDSHGNAIAYESRNYHYPSGIEPGRDSRLKKGEGPGVSPKTTTEDQSKPKTKPEPEIKVEKLELVNDYSRENLLTKRYIYLISPQGERTLVAIDRVIYEKEPLLVKPWYVEKENDYGDYGDE
jgi:hypothetical protein